MPRATISVIRFGPGTSPRPHNPLGLKGAGEAGFHSLDPRRMNAVDRRGSARYGGDHIESLCDAFRKFKREQECASANVLKPAGRWRWEIGAAFEGQRGRRSLQKRWRASRTPCWPVHPVRTREGETR